MGPEGGDSGGSIVVEGTPERVAEHGNSYTGAYLGPVLAEENYESVRG
jgi:excinuclease ABC subunit A